MTSGYVVLLCLITAAVGYWATLSADTPIRPLAPGDTMPRLKGEFLTGREAVLPDAARGKVALLGRGFSYDSRFPVEAWMTRFRELYPPGDHQTFFEVPMLGAGARLGRWFVDSGMRRGTPHNVQENVIPVCGGTGDWKTRLRVVNDKLGYLVIAGSRRPRSLAPRRDAG